MKVLKFFLLILIISTMVLNGQQQNAPIGFKQAVEVEKDLIMTVNSVRTIPVDAKAANKGIYYIINITLENNAREEKNISTFYSMKLESSNGHNFPVVVVSGTEGSLDGVILAGRKRTGEIAYGGMNSTTEVDVFMYRSGGHPPKTTMFNVKPQKNLF